MLKKSFFFLILPAHVKKDSLDEEPMQTDMAESPYVPGADENPLYTAEPLTLDDLTLLSDLFYLPYEHGPTARTMLQELDWLKNHSVVASADTDQVLLPPPARAGVLLAQFVRVVTQLSPSDGRVGLQSAAVRWHVRGGGADVQPAVQRAQPQHSVRPLQLHL